MASALPLKEIRTLLNRPGEEIDQRLRAAKNHGVDLSRIETGYIVELEGNIEKNAEGELEFVGSATTGIKALPDNLSPVDLDAESAFGKTWGRRGESDVYMRFWFRIRPTAK